MEDHEIIKLYFSRSDQAIQETAAKYGHYCFQIAFRILDDFESSEECVNDSYLSVWNHIPPDIPECFRAYIGRITRNLSLDRYRAGKAQKRSTALCEQISEELRYYAAADKTPFEAIDKIAFKEIMHKFLSSLSKQDRIIFVRRYWFFNKVKEIAELLRMSESSVKMSLFRSRKALRKDLEEGGMYL